MDYDFDTQILEIAQPCMAEGEEAYMVLGALYVKCSEASARMVWHGIIRAFGLKAIKNIKSLDAERFAFYF